MTATQLPKESHTIDRLFVCIGIAGSHAVHCIAADLRAKHFPKPPVRPLWPLGEIHFALHWLVPLFRINYTRRVRDSMLLRCWICVCPVSSVSARSIYIYIVRSVTSRVKLFARTIVARGRLPTIVRFSSEYIVCLYTQKHGSARGFKLVYLFVYIDSIVPSSIGRKIQPAS